MYIAEVSILWVEVQLQMCCMEEMIQLNTKYEFKGVGNYWGKNCD